MRISGSGHKRADTERVTINFEGTSQEVVRLIDALSTVLDAYLNQQERCVIDEIMRQVNWHAGQPIDLPKPQNEVSI